MNGEENKRRDEICTAKWFIGVVIPPMLTAWCPCRSILLVLCSICPPILDLATWSCAIGAGEEREEQRTQRRPAAGAGKRGRSGGRRGKEREGPAPSGRLPDLRRKTAAAAGYREDVNWLGYG